MLTFEKVFEVFADYLKEDTACEVIKTKRAYIIGLWEECCSEYEFLETYTTPEAMKARLIQEYEGYLTYQITKAIRDKLTADERKYIDTKVKEMLDKFV